MMTASHKKSIYDYYKRKDEIGDIADMLLGLFHELPSYRQDVTEETLFPPEGQIFPEADTPHYVIESHADPFIHLGNIIHTIHRLRDFMLSELGMKMSGYLMYEMIYSGLDETNNVLRFCKFADLHYSGWTEQRADPLPFGKSFLDCFQLFLRENYPANDGKAGMKGGVEEGAVRYGPSNNTPRLVATCHQNVRALFDVVTEYSKKKVAESSYAAMLATLNADTTGASELKLQKMLYAVACCDE